MRQSLKHVDSIGPPQLRTGLGFLFYFKVSFEKHPTLHCRQVYVHFYRTRVRSLVMLVSNSLTDWLTNCRLVNLIDVSLACEDGNSKLVEVITVVVDAEDNVGNSLLQIWGLTFGPKAKLMFRLWAQGLVKILKLRFRQDFEAGFCSAFCRWCFVEVMKLNLGWDSEARFGQDFEF